MFCASELITANFVPTDDAKKIEARAQWNDEARSSVTCRIRISLFNLTTKM